MALPQECLELNTRLATQKPINQPLNHGVLGYSLVMLRVTPEGWMFCSFYGLSVHELTSNANGSRRKSLNYSEAPAPFLNTCRSTDESVRLCINLYTHRQMHTQPRDQIKQLSLFIASIGKQSYWCVWVCMHGPMCLVAEVIGQKPCLPQLLCSLISEKGSLTKSEACWLGYTDLSSGLRTFPVPTYLPALRSQVCVLSYAFIWALGNLT